MALNTTSSRSKLIEPLWRGSLLPFGCAAVVESHSQWGGCATQREQAPSPQDLLLIRLFQGFSASGEYAGASAFLAEYAPEGKRGLYTSIVPASTAAGLLFGALFVAGLHAWMSVEGLHDWGWRLPFLLAAPDRQQNGPGVVPAGGCGGGVDCDAGEPGDGAQGVAGLTEARGVLTDAFASKPAPTFNRVLPDEYGQRWERACSRRGQTGHPHR